MIIRLWHNRRITATPTNDETSEPLSEPPQGITPGDDLMEVHSIPDWKEESMPKTHREAETLLERIRGVLTSEHISVMVGDVIQIEKRFWACETIGDSRRVHKWMELQLTDRIFMYWTKLEHSGDAPCSCPECLQLVAGE